MINNLALVLFLGKPLVVYLGVATFILLLTTAAIGYLKFKGKNIAFKWHPILALISIITALIHGVLGLSIYFNF